MLSLGPALLSSGCQTAIRKFLLKHNRVDFMFKLANFRAFSFYRPFNSDWTVQRLLIGTHTSNDEQNYVQIIKVKIPLESSKDTREYREGLDETNGPN